MEDDAPTLRRLRADLAALDTTTGAQALKLVIGWAEYGAFKEGAPFSEDRVRSLVELAVQRFSKEASVYAGGGDASNAEESRRSAVALAPYL